MSALLIIRSVCKHAVMFPGGWQVSWTERVQSECAVASGVSSLQVRPVQTLSVDSSGAQQCGVEFRGSQPRAGRSSRTCFCRCDCSCNACSTEDGGKNRTNKKSQQINKKRKKTLHQKKSTPRSSRSPKTCTSD